MSPGAHAPLRVEARTASADATRAVAAAMAPALVPGDVLLLVGDLGAGKTTFVQGLARGLGVDEQVTSPTFTLVRPYPCAPADRAGGTRPVRTLLHADLYRVERLQEVTDLALGELVEDAAVAAVEWGDVGAPVLGDDALVVRLSAAAPSEGGADDDGDEMRLVTVEVPSDRAELAEELRARLAPWAPGVGSAR